MSSAPPPPIATGPPLEAPREKGGCLKAGLIGCGALALLCVLLFVGGVLYVRKNPGFFLDIAMGQIEKNYGPDVTETDKRELKAAVEDFKQAIKTNRVRKDKGGNLQASFTSRGGRSEKLTHEDVRQLIRAFREAVGSAPPQTPDTVPTLAPIAVPTPS